MALVFCPDGEENGVNYSFLLKFCGKIKYLTRWVNELETVLGVVVVRLESQADPVKKNYQHI